jgi:hypothetical protein
LFDPDFVSARPANRIADWFVRLIEGVEAGLVPFDEAANTLDGKARIG